MSDLNQMTQRVKAGIDLEAYREQISFLINEFATGVQKNDAKGPICCFYVCEPWAIPQKLILDGFQNYAHLDTERVIGCSRGCLPVGEEITETMRRYADKLCNGCVADARRILRK